MNEPEERGLIMGAQFPELARQCDDAAEAGRVMWHLRHGGEEQPARCDGGPAALQPFIPEAGKPMPCIACGGYGTSKYNGRFFQIMLCDACKEEMDPVDAEALQRCAKAAAWWAADCFDRFHADRRALIIETGRLSEALRVSEAARTGIVEQWDASARASRAEIDRLRSVAKKCGWLAVGLAAALGALALGALALLIRR